MAMLAAGAPQDGVPARTIAPTIDWTGHGWSAGALAWSRPVAGAGMADFLVLTAQPKSGRGQDARQGG
jgi:hypothetical protein